MIFLWNPLGFSSGQKHSGQQALLCLPWLWCPGWAGNLSQQLWGCEHTQAAAQWGRPTGRAVRCWHPLLTESWLLCEGLRTSLWRQTWLEGECWALSSTGSVPHHGVALNAPPECKCQCRARGIEGCRDGRTPRVLQSALSTSTAQLGTASCHRDNSPLATQPHPPFSCTGLSSWCWLCWAAQQPAPGSQDGLDHCHPAPHGLHATIPSVLLHPVLVLSGEDMMCLRCVPCLCWQPCPSWCSSSQAVARLGFDAHTQRGEYQHAQEWEPLPLWSCGRNDAKRAQQPWHRLRGHAWLPQTLLQTSALWER